MFLTDRFTWPRPRVSTFWHSQTVFRDTWAWAEWQPPSPRQANTNLRLYARHKEREWNKRGERGPFRVLQLSAFVLPATDVLIKMLDKPLTRSSWRFHLDYAICSEPLILRWNVDPVSDGDVARLLINSYGNNGMSLYCQPASSHGNVYSFSRRPVWNARRFSLIHICIYLQLRTT